MKTISESRAVLRHRWSRAFGIGLVVGVLTAMLASAAPARTAADDVNVLVTLGRSGGRSLEKQTGPNFQIVVGVESASGVQQTVTVTTLLPDGLRWGATPPHPNEGCSGTTPVRCTGRTSPGLVGTVGVGWYWDVVAERPGTYQITASVEPTEPDPDLSNNAHAFRFDVVRSAGSGGTSVSASAAKLTPVKPKAGSTVAARVRVAAGGAPVKPTRIACAGTIGSAKIKGASKAASGSATCVYRTPRSAKGKTLRGAVSFTARGKRFTKRFAAKLG